MPNLVAVSQTNRMGVDRASKNFRDAGVPPLWNGAMADPYKQAPPSFQKLAYSS